MADSDIILSVDNLSIDFNLRTHILHAARDVSFELYRGKTLCLVGESGSGKSVTARALLRLIDKNGAIASGRILLRSEGTETDIVKLNERSRELLSIRGGRIGLIFQEPMSSLSPVHTIGSQIVEALRLHQAMDKRQARAATIELLRQVEIPNPETQIDRYTFEFSGGMRQRAMIAMALACNPDILIADEPTTALDVTTQAEILDLIKRLQVSRGMAMLLITHDMGIVAEVADEVAVMHYGRIVEQGSVDGIFHDARHPYTKRLLASTVRLEQTPRSLTRPATVAPVEAKPVISVRELSKFYGGGAYLFGRKGTGVRAVESVSLDLMPGENLGIVGESGSGKTTLGRLILRTVEPTSGTITYNDRDGRAVNVTGLSKRDLRTYHRDVRLVFQDPFASLNPRMTVKEVIGDPLFVAGLAKGAALERRVGELMDLVGLDPQSMERYPHAFSGGQRQRIGIARALALDPRVIIADEATAALDVSIRAQILDLLLDIQKRLSLSFIFISHDISVVRYFCDRVAVMHRGKVVETGTAEQICTAPTEAYTQSLISAVPNPDPRNKRMLHRTRFTAEAAPVKFSANLSFLYQELGFLDRFAAAARDGFPAVEYMAPYAEPKDKVAESLRANNLAQALFNTPSGDWAGGERGIAALPGRQDEFRAGIDTALDYARALNCPKVNVISGLIKPGADLDAMEATLVANLKHAAPQAADAGVKLLIEPINTRDIPGFFLSTTRHAERILEQVGHDNLYIQYDLYHAQVMQGDLIPTFERLRDRIAHIQVADNPGRNEPGTGEINWSFVLPAIERLGYDGYIGCEYKPKTTTTAGLGWLKPFLTEAPAAGP